LAEEQAAAEQGAGAPGETLAAPEGEARGEGPERRLFGAVVVGRFETEVQMGQQEVVDFADHEGEVLIVDRMKKKEWPGNQGAKVGFERGRRFKDTREFKMQIGEDEKDTGGLWFLPCDELVIKVGGRGRGSVVFFGVWVAQG
jgi:hypothetical protein